IAPASAAPWQRVPRALPLAAGGKRWFHVPEPRSLGCGNVAARCCSPRGPSGRAQGAVAHFLHANTWEREGTLCGRAREQLVPAARVAASSCTATALPGEPGPPGLCRCPPAFALAPRS
uniref:Uncharacterized protein n=1 Tax=Nothoprocta perdicaria TaxID=30464 RepID=A0A8C6Z509_NOTPE